MNAPRNGPRLYRSQDRMIAGVASGVADYFDVDPSIVRILWAISMPFSGFVTLLIYIVMAVVVPEEPDVWPDYAPGGPPGPGGVPPAAVPPSGPLSADEAAAAGASTGQAGWMSTAAQETAGAATDTATAPAFVAGGTPPPAADWRAARRADRYARRQERWERRIDRWEGRRHGGGSGALVFGLLLVIVGAVFLAHQLVPSIDTDQVWPVALIAIGVIFLIFSVTGRSDRV